MRKEEGQMQQIQRRRKKVTRKGKNKGKPKKSSKTPSHNEKVVRIGENDEEKVNNAAHSSTTRGVEGIRESNGEKEGAAKSTTGATSGLL